MRPAVLAAFRDFSVPFEGYTDYMYLDRKGYVTTGIGNLIDPVAAALRLPWQRTDGSLASQEEIRDAWVLVKSRLDLASHGGGAYKGVTSLRLSKRAIADLFDSKVREVEKALVKRFPAFESWPADAQLGVLSMSWAMGAAFRFPRFSAAVSALLPDFLTAAVESHIGGDEVDTSLRKRNAANASLFTNAARVLAGNLDPGTLYFPRILPAGVRASHALVITAAFGAAGLGAWWYLKKR